MNYINEKGEFYDRELLAKLVEYSGYESEHIKEAFRNGFEFNSIDNKFSERYLLCVSRELGHYFDKHPPMEDCKKCDNGIVTVIRGDVVEAEYECDCNGGKVEVC